jgi:hypothetical protein
MVTRGLLRSAGFAFAGALVATTLLAASARAADTAQVTLALPSVNISFTALYLAEDLHLWADQGLEVKTMVIPGVGTNNAVINGSVQFAIGSSDAITRGWAHGQHMQAIGAGVKKTMEWVMIRKDIADAAHFDPNASLTERAKILKGKTIAITGIGSLPDAVLKSVASEAGIGPSDIETPTMLPPDGVENEADRRLLQRDALCAAGDRRRLGRDGLRSDQGRADQILPDRGVDRDRARRLLPGACRPLHQVHERHDRGHEDRGERPRQDHDRNEKTLSRLRRDRPRHGL